MRLIAKIFEHTDFRGKYRYIDNDVPNFGNVLGFNDKVSSIIIYRGQDYVDGDRVRFYQHANYEGGYLELEPGNYQNIHNQPYSFGDKISSADFLPVESTLGVLTVKLEIYIFEHINYAGQMREIMVDERSLGQLGFNDKVSSIRIFPGDAYQPGDVANFHQHKDFGGGILSPGNFGPGTNIPNLTQAPYSFNDAISSISISNQSPFSFKNAINPLNIKSTIK